MEINTKRNYYHKYQKYLNKYLEAIFNGARGGGGGGGGPYTSSCSLNSKGNKLNQIGLDKYLHYKKVSCQDLEWVINSCNKTNDPDELKRLSSQYLQCAEDRESFSEDCVVSIDDNHQHAIDRMREYHQGCEERLKNFN